MCIYCQSDKNFIALINELFDHALLVDAEFVLVSQKVIYFNNGRKFTFKKSMP